MIQSSINYLPVNEEDLESGMYVRGVGFQSIKELSSYPISGHHSDYDFDPSVGRTLGIYSIVYLSKGEGSYTSSSLKNVPLQAGEVIVLHPHNWHTYKPKNTTGWDEYWVTFYGEIFESYLNQIASPDCPILDIGLNSQIEELFSEMIMFAKKQEVGYQRPLNGILLHLLGIIHSIERNKLFDNRDVKRIQYARTLMRENVNSTITPEQIAELLNISYSSFRKLFKQYTGLAPLQYMLQLRIEKAKEHLVYTNSSIKEIASKLNYDSIDYFSFFFRSKVGLSPQEYRKKHKQK